VCIRVRCWVEATYRKAVLAAARVKVSSACTTGVPASRARSAGRKPVSSRRAALARRDAANPVDTFIPHSSITRSVERCTGMSWPRTASATY
jgi:hypothetical protein